MWYAAHMKAAKTARSLAAIPPVESDERHQADVDAFIERNQGPLNDSIRRSRAELAKGVTARRTIGRIIEDARRKRGEG